MFKYPMISEELIEYLEKTFIKTYIEPSDSLQEIMYDAGKIAVVRHLKFIYNQQLEQ